MVGKNRSGCRPHGLLAAKALLNINVYEFEKCVSLIRCWNLIASMK